MDSERDLILDDARSISEGLWRIARLVKGAAEVLAARIKDEDLDGLSETVEIRGVLERVQDLSLEVREELDAYQGRHRAKG